jgi:hypothetical protein
VAYESSTASSISDLFDKLATFATANGWTKNEPAGLTTDRLCLSKSGVFVNFRWATTSPTAVGIYHALGYTTSATNPGNHTSDSGNGFYSATTVTNANILSSRYALVTNGSMTYWFFENDSSPAYIHVVVTTGALQYSHFGFGELIKQGTWTGGEYAYGHYYNTAGTNVQLAETSSFLLDGGLGNQTPTTYRPFAATVHIESLPGQAASTKWGLSWGGDSAGTDRATLTRYNIQGGFRGGPVAAAFARFTSSPTTGLSAMYPVNLFYDGAGSPRQWYPLGYMGDVRGIDTLNYSEAQEITVGADTWVVFPVTYKPAVAALGACRTMGVAYKKVTA